MEEFELEDIPGVGRITAKKLRAAGIRSPRFLTMLNPEELMEIADIDNPIKAARIIREAKRLYGIEMKPISAREFKEEYLKWDTISFNVKALDELTRGGISVKELVEFAGEFGSGKTQICHQLAVTAQLPPSKGGVAGSVVYIDTERTFSPGRIEKIAERFGLDNALNNIYLFRPTTVTDLEECVFKLYNLIEEKNVRLVIVDSIIALYRAQLKGMEWLARRQQRLNYVIDFLKRYAERFNLAVVYTNQVLQQLNLPHITMKLPAGGNIIAHAATHRFLLKYAKDDTRIITVFDSPRLPRNASVQFRITEQGLMDVE